MPRPLMETEMPTLTATRSPSTPSGRRDSSEMSRALSATALRRLLTSGASTTNSSPPIRATVSMGRRAATSLSATRRSTASPAACPSESFTHLNRSRSTKSTAVHRPERFAWDRACSIRSTRRARFGRPVSGSCVACVMRASCAPCSSAIRAAWASPSRLISRSWALFALRSVNVRQVRRSPSTSSGELPTRTGTATPSPFMRSSSTVTPRPPGPRSSSRPIGARPAMNAASGDPTIAPLGRSNSSASR